MPDISSTGCVCKADVGKKSDFQKLFRGKLYKTALPTGNLVEQFNEDDYKLKFSDLFEYLGIIGKGAFGIALKAKSKNSNSICAVKVYSIFYWWLILL